MRKRAQRRDEIAAITSDTFAPTRGRGRPRVEKPPTTYALASATLRAKFPTLESLPPIFSVNVLADSLSAGLPVRRRRGIASRWLSEIGAVALGTFLRGQSFAMWARTAASCRGMSKTEIMSIALGPESLAFPPQRIPTDWRAEYRRLLPHTRARGYLGPAHKQWRWAGPVRKEPATKVNADSPPLQPARPVAPNPETAPRQPTAPASPSATILACFGPNQEHACSPTTEMDTRPLVPGIRVE